MTDSRVWLVTGASSGFGLELVKHIARRGDLVIAASRDPAKLAGLGLGENVTAARLDQNEALPQLRAAMDDIVKIHGAVDVVVANAGYVQTGTVEESTPAETQAQFRANVLGAVDVYRAALPHMRARRSGTLVTVGSMAAWFPLAGCNVYNASKAALRRLALGLGDEVRAFGVRHCLVEPGFFRTALLTPGQHMTGSFDTRIPDYADVNRAAAAAFAGFDGAQLGDPAKGAAVLYDVVTSSGRAAGRELPSFLPLGSDAVARIREEAQAVIDEVNAWEDIASQSDYTDGK
ncbi:hypothetical protein GGR52DRAFT_127322 [Hypoxylon sp. FL1284]|nr:hypothetical protein GGR52DRAFT_127322 [Hypoxylon sp. FL1284]